MRYLTKEWYGLCQATDLHFDMRVHKGVGLFDEALYARLYRRKEEEFVEMQREVYNVDPRYMLDQDGEMLVPLDLFLSGEEISEEDRVIYVMPPEEKEAIQQLVVEYDGRLPFDEEQWREDFRDIQDMTITEAKDRLPADLYQQIADIRVFSLGYCTREIKSQLKVLSRENEKRVDEILNQYAIAMEKEDIPENIRERFSFHDSMVLDYRFDKNNVVMELDNRGGFTDFNLITFVDAEIINEDESIETSFWLYEELYRTENGFEAHMLFAGEGLAELIIRCKDIIVEEA